MLISHYCFLSLFTLYEKSQRLGELDGQRRIDGWNASGCVEFTLRTHEDPHEFGYCELSSSVRGFHGGYPSIPKEIEPFCYLNMSDNCDQSSASDRPKENGVRRSTQRPRHHNHS